MTRIWLLAFLLANYAGPSFATITHGTIRCQTDLCFEVTDSISRADLQQLAHAVELMKVSRATPTFFLNSSGGDVEVAIAIGRQLRKYRATAVTWSEGRCYSSCVFILAGAVRRFMSTSIGIHRPYSMGTDERDYASTQASQRRLTKSTKDYLEEMNVSPSLYDAMVSIPPERIKLLSKSELESFGLLEIDPVEDELGNAASARHYGTSKVEYLRRKARVSVACANEHQRGTYSGNFDSFNDCREDVLRLRR